MLSRLLPSLFIFAIALSLGLSAANGGQKGAGKKPVSPYAKEIVELHGVKMMLERADRDYKGHRAEAVKQITVAIHSMEAGFAHVKHPGENAKAGGGEPQALSDAQLKDAIDKLTRIQKQMGAQGNNASYQVAGTSLAAAVTELQTALTIK